MSLIHRACAFFCMREHLQITRLLERQNESRPDWLIKQHCVFPPQSGCFTRLIVSALAARKYSTNDYYYTVIITCLLCNNFSRPSSFLFLLSPRRRMGALRDGALLLFVCLFVCLSPETRNLYWRWQELIAYVGHSGRADLFKVCWRHTYIHRRPTYMTNHNTVKATSNQVHNGLHIRNANTICLLGRTLN